MITQLTNFGDTISKEEDMFERILLPLDGSQLAESAIPYGEELAGRLGSEVILLHAFASQQQPFYYMHKLYLENMASTIRHNVKKKFPRSKECQVRAEVVFGEPADVICDYVDKNDIGMVVLATHGASGLKVWVMGSVVDKIVRAANVPTLLIRAKEDRSAERKKRLISRILLPLDGSDASRISVPYALELAKKLKASIVLYRMVQRAYSYLAMEGIAAGGALDLARMEAAAERSVRAYLVNIEKELRQNGVPVTHSVTYGIDAAQEILAHETKAGVDLVAMTTRGRSPIARWVFGSVAEKIIREGDLPLLLIRRPTD
ncbi:universal stress protein [Chloroflexota bacterium]